MEIPASSLCRGIDRKYQDLYPQAHDQGKEPPAAAKGMSWLKTNWKLGMEDSDRTAAGLITDGCGMGVKTLYRYLNQYRAADEASKSIAGVALPQQPDGIRFDHPLKPPHFLWP